MYHCWVLGASSPDRCSPFICWIVGGLEGALWEGQDSWANLSKAHLETFGQLLFTNLYRRILVVSQLMGTSWYHPWSNREQGPDSPPILRVPLAHLSPLWALLAGLHLGALLAHHHYGESQSMVFFWIAKCCQNSWPSLLPSPTLEILLFIYFFNVSNMTSIEQVLL